MTIEERLAELEKTARKAHGLCERVTKLENIFRPVADAYKHEEYARRTKAVEIAKDALRRITEVYEQ